jgi:uncharacterized membrane protein
MSSVSVFELTIWILALAFLFSPGWLLIFWLFPNERPLWQIAVSSGTAVALLGVIALSLSYLPAGITRDSIAIVIVILNSLLAVLFWLGPERVIQRLSQLISGLGSLRKSGWKDSLPAALFVLIFITFLMFTLSLSQGRKESYTEFYISDGFLRAPPWRRHVEVSDVVPLTFAVASSENRAESCHVHVVAEGEPIEVIHLGVLQPGESVQRSISIPPRDSLKQLYLLELYKSDLKTPYRTLHFWLRTLPEELVD